MIQVFRIRFTANYKYYIKGELRIIFKYTVSIKFKYME
jgi:hypothetical protein